jgi:V/A-type H+-transporting ATPase subunit I
MLKYHFLVFYREADQMLEVLKKFGAVHVKRVKRESDPNAARLRRRLSDLKQTASQLDKIIALHSTNAAPASLSTNVATLETSLEKWQAHTKAIPKLEEELYHVRSFGPYNKDKIIALKQAGLFLHLYSVPLGKLKPEWSKTYALELLHDSGRKTWFVIVSDSDIPPTIKAQKEELPEHSPADLEHEIKLRKSEREALEAWLFKNAENLKKAIEEESIGIKEQLQDLNAREQMMQMGFGKVIMLQGWVPAHQADALEQTLSQTDTHFERIAPSAGDKPPIMLKNRVPARWFEPIAKLFAMPTYFELDLTPFFAPFFMLFFGLCLGDGGYGLLMFLILLALGSKVPADYKGIWKLALVLEFFAIIMGLVSGTFFGINLLETDVPILVDLRGIMLNADQLFNFALLLGAIQIMFGLALKAVNQWRQNGWSYSMSPVGWMLLLAGIGGGALSAFTLLYQVLCWSGVGLIIVFSDPKGSIGVRLGKGLWDLYGITGVFGDLLSYIRLFALGLAGSILGFVVNDISLAILGSHSIIGPVFFVVMLIIGHGLNIFIASLGAFVHPMRLTFVEFYKNAGFEGGGDPYKPLASGSNIDKQ